ncbi:MAG: hypothetical protein IKB11_02710, partial [Bacteroidaceae bacterium]|nr:hypothetical protein [Bacteroidaceae bacterium]
MRKFTSLMLMLLCAVTTWAGVTDLPEMSTEGNTKWYTIKNVRRAKYATYAGESTSMTQQSSVQDGSLFYFTGSVVDGVATVKIHNAQAGDLLCAGTNSWTAEGIDWYIAAKTATGLSISKTADFSGQNSWNDFQGSGTSVDYWTATDPGSIWEIAEFGADIQVALDEIMAFKDNHIFGKLKYTESSYNELYAAYETFKTNATIANYEACTAIINNIETYMPEVGKFYIIEAPLFYNTQSVHKALYSDGTNPGWKTLDKSDKSFYWTPVATDNGIALKNVNDNKYILGEAANNTAWTMTETANGAEFDVIILESGETQADYQYSISIVGRHMHANNHGGGAGNANNIVSYETNNPNSASAWTFTETADPDANVPVTIVYNFMYEGVKKYTQTTETIAGDNYPAVNIALPFGVSATVPEEAINAEDATEVDGVKTITKELTLSISLPFEYFNSYGEVTQWYYVNVRDDGPTYMYYDSSIEYIKATATEVPSDAKDAYSWAFVGNPFDGFKVVNLLAGSAMVLSSPATPTANQDASQIVRMVTEEGATGNTDWDFMKPTHANAAANGFYMQHPTAPTYALNRQGYNGANTLCYWDRRDTGSTFQVVARPTVQGELEALIATAEAKLATMESLKSEAAGFYPQATIDELAAAISVAQEVTVADEEDITTLQAAIDAVYTNTPAIGSFIAFQSASTQTYCAGKYVKTVPVVTTYEGAGYSADRDHTQLVFDTFEPATTPSAVFQVIAGDNEGEFKLKNMHTQEYVVSFVKGAQHMGAEANAVAVRLEPLGKEQQVAVYGANHADPMHAQEAHNVIVTWDTSADGASAWNIINVESFAHVLTISEVGYATLKLGFDATIPEGVECYYAIEAIDENGVLNLEQITGILPANTAVIVKLAEGYAAGDYNFAYSATAGTAVEGNKLAGSVYDENITPAGTAYVLSAPAGKVGLYKAELSEGAFQNNANKVYFDAPAATEIVSYSFNFDWAGTTGIEGVVAEGAQDGAIYDITGRRVKAITAPGIYIVNGRKVVK